MALSNDLISQFAKITKDNNKKETTETTVYGTVKYNGKYYVQLDGSDLLTPVKTTTDVEDGERVTVMIKDHTATITGNISSPSARTATVKEMGDQITDFEVVVAHRVSTDDLTAVHGYIENLKAITAKFTEMSAITAKIEQLQAKIIEGEKLKVEDIEAINIDVDNIKADFGEFDNVSAEDLEAFNAEITNLKAYAGNFTYLSAVKADIQDLNAKKLSAEDALLKYVSIDFANIDKAWMEEFYARSGIIEYITTDGITSTGRIIGVTITGDLIEAGTLKADRLVIKDEKDGLYYKLNFEGGAFTDAEEVPTDGLHGSVIVANSITAEKVSVSDLVAFDATIAGFHITPRHDQIAYYKAEYDTTTGACTATFEEIDPIEIIGQVGKIAEINRPVYYGMSSTGDTIYFYTILPSPGSIYSEVKDSEDNTTRGIYMDTDGQVNFGDARNFIRYVKDDDGNYKLAIAASELSFAINGAQTDISSLGDLVGNVEIGAYENEPCIRLGKESSEFKLYITNTRILFMEDESPTAWISNKALHITKATVTDELRFGNFIWQKRTSGNMGLLWSEVSE